MEKYTIIKNAFYEIFIPESLQEYRNEVIKYSTDKLEEFLCFFKEENYGQKIKASFFWMVQIFLTELKNNFLIE